MSEESTDQATFEDLLPKAPASRLPPRPPLTLSLSHIPPRVLPPQQNFRPQARRSTAENGSGGYLHIRFLRRGAKTPSVSIKQEGKERPPTEGFTRTRNTRLASSDRPITQQAHRQTIKPMPASMTSRPLASNNNEKTAYFDDLLSPCSGLKDLKLMSHIGRGAFSIVSMAVARGGKESYAVKAYDKLDSLDWNRLACIKRQVKHLRALDSERVVKLHLLARQHRKLYLVMENAGKQSLAGLLRKEKKLPQGEARRYFAEILEGVAYCHGQGVCHRDLKPQNILLDQKGKIKLIDFGFSASSRNTLTTFCGTPAYMSPELVKKSAYNGGKADVWALGVVLYLMLVGVLPFRAANEQELYRLISAGKVRYRDQGAVSPQAKRFIGKMLTLSPEERPSVGQLLSDPWIGGQ